ncbi:MAG: YraN family protein [Candidatus Paceibacterota bacterium]
MAQHNKLGELGESIAKRFLVKRGFQAVDQNYRRKWGEIDLIMKKVGRLHFVEVKSVSRESVKDVLRETAYRPEENIHPKKIQRLSRVIQSYLAGKSETEWQFDVVAVFISVKEKKAKVRLLEDVVL